MKLRNRVWGQNLRRYRISSGLTGTALAKKTGFSTSWHSKVEGGNVVPDAFAIKVLSDALGVDVSKFSTIPSMSQLDQHILYVASQYYFKKIDVGVLVRAIREIEEARASLSDKK